MPSREDIIKTVFENTSALKRGMYSYLQAASQDNPVSWTQLELLTVIQHLQPVSSKKLAQHLYLTPGAVSQLADSLIQQGLISRKTDPEDRRIQYLQLTQKGQKLLADIDSKRATVMKQAMQDLSTDELAVWAHVQQKLIDRFQSATAKQIKETKPRATT